MNSALILILFIQTFPDILAKGVGGGQSSGFGNVRGRGWQTVWHDDVIL